MLSNSCLEAVRVWMAFLPCCQHYGTNSLEKLGCLPQWLSSKSFEDLVLRNVCDCCYLDDCFSLLSTIINVWLCAITSASALRDHIDFLYNVLFLTSLDLPVVHSSPLSPTTLLLIVFFLSTFPSIWAFSRELDPHIACLKDDNLSLHN